MNAFRLGNGCASILSDLCVKDRNHCSNSASSTMAITNNETGIMSIDKQQKEQPYCISVAVEPVWGGDGMPSCNNLEANVKFCGVREPFNQHTSITLVTLPIPMKEQEDKCFTFDPSLAPEQILNATQSIKCVSITSSSKEKVKDWVWLLFWVNSSILIGSTIF